MRINFYIALKSFTILFFAGVLVFDTTAQTTAESKILGTWSISTHAKTSGDKITHLQFLPWTANTYIFRDDKTFTLKFHGKASDMAQTGNWSINGAGNTVRLFNIKTIIGAPPPNPDGNRSLVFFELTDSTFKIKEFMYDDAKAQVSIYKKVIP